MKDWIDAFGVLQLSWAVAFLLLLPTFLGLLIDRRFHTAPWAILVGALVGTLVATYGVTHVIVRRYDKLAPRDRDRQEEEEE